MSLRLGTTNPSALRLGTTAVSKLMLGTTDVWSAALSYRATVLADNPVAYWRLGESSGTPAADERGTYPGTYAGSPTLGVAGAVVGNTAVSFDGIDDVFQTANNSMLSGSSQMTIEAWINRNGAQPDSGFGTVFNKPKTGGVVNTSIILFLKNTGMRFRLNTTTSDTLNNLWEISTNLATGSWVHAVWTWVSGERPKCYLNGVEQTVTSSPANTISGSIIGNSLPAIIGSDVVNGSTLRLKASLDEVAIYNTALSAERIAAHYNARNNA